MCCFVMQQSTTHFYFTHWKTKISLLFRLCVRLKSFCAVMLRKKMKENMFPIMLAALMGSQQARQVFLHENLHLSGAFSGRGRKTRMRLGADSKNSFMV